MAWLPSNTPDTNTSPAPPKQAQTTPTPTPTTADAHPPTLSPTPTTPPDPTHPTHLSCRTTFDAAFYCSSLGGHFNDIYRYGQLRSCSEHWNDFWFCMRTKNSYGGEEAKRRAVQQLYREKEDRVRAGPNSEWVWRRRGEGEGVRGAFGRGIGEGGEGGGSV
ncbi:hypothetical protein BDW02DRAFT_630489 [Decorospora gaudefroyi]|uniref:Uncharacterized protein n=1 Tax=Decorospora gaudefroyi TaxID=184978 RepID=A0A6A5KDM2_9PLEO|nr:hypothetical protein BDW02DRAFT_630489 [Decorospora gaudefroyi]